MNISQFNDFGASKTIAQSTSSAISTSVNPKQQGASIAPSGSTEVNSGATQTGGSGKLTPTEVVDIVQKANKALQDSSSNLKFTVDKTSGSDVVQIVDGKTQEILRQIPSEEMLKIAKAVEKMQGVLVSTQA